MRCEAALGGHTTSSERVSRLFRGSHLDCRWKLKSECSFRPSLPPPLQCWGRIADQALSTATLRPQHWRGGMGGGAQTKYKKTRRSGERGWKGEQTKLKPRHSCGGSGKVLTEYKPHAFHHTRQTPINTRSDRNIIAPTLISISVYGTGGVLVSLSQISKWIELVPTLEILFRCTRYKIEQKPVRAPACYLLSKLAFFRKKAQEQVPL